MKINISLLGLPSHTWSTSGVQSLKSLSATCIALNAEDTKLSHLQSATVDLHMSLMKTEDSLKKKRKKNSDMAASIQQAIIYRDKVLKLYKDMNESEVQEQALLAQKEKQAIFLDKKVQQYSKQIKKLDLQIQTNYDGQEVIEHEQLEAKGNLLNDLKVELQPIHAKLNTYHSLPANLSLTKVKIEEAKLQLDRLEEKLEHGIDLLGL